MEFGSRLICALITINMSLFQNTKLLGRIYSLETVYPSLQLG